MSCTSANRSTKKSLMKFGSQTAACDSIVDFPESRFGRPLAGLYLRDYISEEAEVVEENNH